MQAIHWPGVCLGCAIAKEDMKQYRSTRTYHYGYIKQLIGVNAPICNDCLPFQKITEQKRSDRINIVASCGILLVSIFITGSIFLQWLESPANPGLLIAAFFAGLFVVAFLLLSAMMILERPDITSHFLNIVASPESLIMHNLGFIFTNRVYALMFSRLNPKCWIAVHPNPMNINKEELKNLDWMKPSEKDTIFTGWSGKP